LTIESTWDRISAQNERNYDKNCAIIQGCLKNNRGFVIESPEEELVMILYSGGLNSTVLIEWVLQNWNCKLILLYIRRDTKNQQWEEQAVDYFYQFYKERYPSRIIDCMKINVQIPLQMNKEYLDRSREKVLGIPFCNVSMWNTALVQMIYLSGKYRTTIRTLLIGNGSEDERRLDVGSLSLLSTCMNVCITTGVWIYQILAPFMDDSFQITMNKSAIVKYGLLNEIPLEKTRSCATNEENPCNDCDACNKRNEAFTNYE
jgi:7-cyano-7-deazaguanine synthase in queuosine biosynthesis